MRRFKQLTFTNHNSRHRARNSTWKTQHPKPTIGIEQALSLMLAPVTSCDNLTATQERSTVVLHTPAATASCVGGLATEPCVTLPCAMSTGANMVRVHGQKAITW